MDYLDREDTDFRINNKECRAAIIKDDEILLMFRRKEGVEYYVFPGGHMQIGETPEDTIIREIYEETGVTVTKLRPAYEAKNYEKCIKKTLSMDEIPNRKDCTEKILYHYFFLCKWSSGEPRLVGEELRRCTKDNFFEPRWVKLSDMLKLEVYPYSAKGWLREFYHL